MPKTISDSLLMSLAVVAVVLAVLTFSMPYFLGPDEDDSGRLRLYSAVTSVHIVWFVIVFLCIVVVANLTIAGGEILHSPSTLAFGRVLWFLILELLFIFLLGFLSEMPAKVKRDLAEKKLSGERLQDAADKIYRAIIRP